MIGSFISTKKIQTTHLKQRITHEKIGENFRRPPPIFHPFTQRTHEPKKLSLTPLPIFHFLSLITLLKKSTHYTLHSKTTPVWASPKRRHFAQNGVVLERRVFFNIKKLIN
jgi:hypothetical protein